MLTNRRIPVIDLFAGPGGLGEGFASLGRPENTPRFDIRLSIEMDPVAHQTLELRAFFRQFDHGDAPTRYYDHLRGELTRDELFKKYPQEARSASEEAWHAKLGAIDPTTLRDRISSSLGAHESPQRKQGIDPWVLIGGPPCQAYSLVGRSRNKGIDGYTLAADPKARLYLEYLQLIADFWPSAFVMENVKGLLSSKIDGELIFDNLCEELKDPAEALLHRSPQRKQGSKRPTLACAAGSRKHTYTLHALTRESLFAAKSPTPSDFVIRSELYGIPQARHRLIVIGVRDDLDADKLKALTPAEAPTVETMIRDLPDVRSGLSKETDSASTWVAAVLELCQPAMFDKLKRGTDVDVRECLRQMPIHAKKMAKLGRGAEFIEAPPSIAYESDWFVDPRLGSVCNHATRSHIRADLHRYLFAALYAEVHHRSPVFTPKGLHSTAQARASRSLGYRRPTRFLPRRGCTKALPTRCPTLSG